MSTQTRSPYQHLVAEIVPDLDPRHVEAFMRLEHPTLDHLSRDRFAGEARIAALCVREVGTDEAEALAASFGL